MACGMPDVGDGRRRAAATRHDGDTATRDNDETRCPKTETEETDELMELTEMIALMVLKVLNVLRMLPCRRVLNMSR